MLSEQLKSMRIYMNVLHEHLLFCLAAFKQFVLHNIEHFTLTLRSLRLSYEFVIYTIALMGKLLIKCENKCNMLNYLSEVKEYLTKQLYQIHEDHTRQLLSTIV